VYVHLLKIVMLLLSPIPNAKHCAHSLSTSRASETNLAKDPSEAIRLLGSASRARLLNDPCSVFAIDYISVTFQHCTNVLTASTHTTTSNRAAHD
jgi:hypothetical protein